MLSEGLDVKALKARQLIEPYALDGLVTHSITQLKPDSFAEAINQLMSPGAPLRRLAAAGHAAH